MPTITNLYKRPIGQYFPTLFEQCLLLINRYGTKEGQLLEEKYLNLDKVTDNGDGTAKATFSVSKEAPYHKGTITFDFEKIDLSVQFRQLKNWVHYEVEDAVLMSDYLSTFKDITRINFADTDLEESYIYPDKDDQVISINADEDSLYFKKGGEIRITRYVHPDDMDNPHETTLEQLDAYSYEEAADQLTKKFRVDTLPIDRYGTLNYLPPGISGSFDSATDVKVADGSDRYNDREFLAFALEDDGSLVYLRNGTNGVTQAPFYGYISDPINDHTNYVNTSTAYELPDGHAVESLYQSSQEVLKGITKDEDEKTDGLFLSLTNGTLEASVHSFCTFPYTDELNDIFALSVPILARDKVYLFALPGAYSQIQPNAGPVDIKIYSVPVSDFDGGKRDNVDSVTISYQQGVSHKSLTDDTSTFRLANLPVADNDPRSDVIWNLSYPDSVEIGDLTAQEGGGGRTTLWGAYSEDANRIRLMYVLRSRFQTTSSGFKTFYMTVSFLFNPDDGSCMTEDFTSPTVTIGDDDSFSLDNDQYQLSTSMSDQAVTTTWAWLEKGLYLRSGVEWGSGDVTRLYFYDDPRPESEYEFYETPFLQQAKGDDVAIPSVFGSEVGDSLYSFFPMTKTAGLVFGSSNESSTVLIRFENEDSDPDYPYPLITGDEYNGWEPTNERTDITNLYGDIATKGDSDNKHNGLISVVDGDDVTLATTWFGPATGMERSGGIDSDGKILGGKVSFVESSVTDQLSSIGDRFGGLHDDTFWDIVVPPDDNCPPLLFVYSNTPGSNDDSWVGVFQCGVNKRTGENIELTSVGSLLFSEQPFRVNHDVDDYWSGPGTAVMTTDLSSLLLSKITYFSTGSGWFFSYIASIVMDQSTGLIGTKAVNLAGWVANDAGWAKNIVTQTNTYHTQPGVLFACVPGYGIGKVNGASINQSALLFQWMASNEDEWTEDVSVGNTFKDSLILVSQKVAQGWIVYFNEETPVIFKGQMYTVPTTSIDLRDIESNPANKTFYIYVIMRDGEPRYEITSSFVKTQPGYLPDRIYLGNVYTNDEQIDHFDVRKTSQFMGLRPDALTSGVVTDQGTKKI